MYLFTRSARLGLGDLQDSLSWAVSITEKVNQICGLDFRLWTTVFSPAVGTLAWSATVDSLDVIEATDTKLMADSGYNMLLEHGARHLQQGTVDDSLIQIVFPTEPAPVTANPEYASVVASVLAPGKIAEGFECGVEIAERARKLTGCPTSFGALATGAYGGVAWITTYDSVQQLERAQEQINTDPSFVELVDRKASRAFVAQSTTQSVYRRIT